MFSKPSAFLLNPSCWVLYFCLTGAACGQDKIKDHLDEAKAEYAVALTELQVPVITALKEREKAAIKAGVLEQVELVQQEITRFEQEGILPTSVSIQKYREGVLKARQRLSEAFAEAQMAYTRANELEKAKAIQAAATTFREADPFGAQAPILGKELLANPGCELPMRGGKIPGWENVKGNWSARTDDPLPQEGQAYFFAPDVEVAELRQDVSLAALERLSKTENLQLAFQASVRSYVHANPDSSQIVIEFLDPARKNVLDTFDTGPLKHPEEWRMVQANLIVPVRAKWVRIRLISTRHSGKNNDGYYDNLSLRPYWDFQAK